MIQDFHLLKVAVLGSGKGTNAKAIIDGSFLEGACYEVVVVVSSRAEVGLCDVAVSQGITLEVIDISSEHFERDLIGVLRTQHVDLLALAGFNKLLPSSVISLLEGHVINIHPALLPSFGGKGMYGRRVHEAVVAAGEKISGATVHWVTNEYDEGAIIEQSRIFIKPGATPTQLEQEVKSVEHALYPRVVQFLARMFIQTERQFNLTPRARNL